ncbi:hypothetical protein Tco_0188732 [Tanacetum coccineum]
MLWEWRGIANMDFIQLGGSSRVDEMILARVRSGFAGEKWDNKGTLWVKAGTEENCDPIGTPMESKHKLDLDMNGTPMDATKYQSLANQEAPQGDADYVVCQDTFKSTSGGTQFLGKKLVSWFLKKQDCTSLSTAEAEYVSLSACCTQVL